MKVFVNDVEIEIFCGARARDAVLSYLGGIGRRARKEKIVIRDRWQNVISDDSPMSENRRIYIEISNQPSAISGQPGR